MSQVLELFAQFFDKKFSDLYDFVHLYNKSVHIINKNFQTIQCGDPALAELQSISGFSVRKEETRLSDELRAHIKQALENF